MSDPRKHVFILNPAAGRGRPGETAARIRAVMDGRGLPYVLETTRAPRHAVELARRHAAPGELVVFYACGGDGTLNEVICGAADARHAAVTHYPTGTGNDFIRQFGAGAGRFSDLNALLDGEEHRVDLLQAGERYCLNVFSAGFDAQVPMEMRKFHRFARLGAKVPYNMAVFFSLFKGLGGYFTVRIDGVDHSGDYTLVTAMNGQFYGGGFHPAPGALVNDGWMDILLARKVGVLRFARLVGPYAKGQADRLSVVRTFRARSLTVAPAKPRAVMMDGECFPMESVSLSVRPGMLRFVTPRGLCFPSNGEKTSLNEILEEHGR